MIFVLLALTGFGGGTLSSVQTAPVETMSTTSPVSVKGDHSQPDQQTLNHQLLAALQSSDTAAALTLLNRGADPNTREYSFDYPAWRSLPRKSGLTALMSACGGIGFAKGQEKPGVFKVDPKLIQAMLLHGADVNATDGWGWTALQWLVKNHLDGVSNKASIELLLAKGANPTQWDRDGRSALQMAEQAHAADLLSLLRKDGKHSSP